MRLITLLAVLLGSTCAGLKPHAFVKDRGGEAVTLDELRGRVVVLNFWAEWCPGCVHELPLLAEVSEESGSVLLPAYFDDQPRRPRFRAWLDAQPAWFRERVVWADRSVRAGHDLSMLPLTVVLAKSDGHVVERLVGTVSREKLRAAIARAAAQ